MKTRSKALLLSMCAVVLVIGSVFGTIAYLTDTEAVTNTFSVGSVGLSLDEAKVNVDGSYVTNHDNRTEDGDNEGNAYHLLPGHTYYKDPTVTVDDDSEDAYVRMMVKVENIDKLMQAMPKEDYPTYYNGDLFLLQMLCVDENGDPAWDGDIWNFKTYHADSNTYEFRYHEMVEGGKDDDDQGKVLEDLFTHITVPGEIDNDHLAHLQDVKIIVTAHAIQADGFDDADDAWAAFKT